MKRMKIIVHGEVQRVGYRDRVASIARKLGIKGSVRNLEDEVTVEIIAQAEEKSLEEFVKLIKISDSPIEVEKIDIKEERATEEFKHFKIIRGEAYEELGERIDAAGKILYGMDKKMANGFSETNRNLKEGFAGVNDKLDKGFTETNKNIKDSLSETNKNLENIDEKLEFGFGETHKGLEKINITLETRLFRIEDEISDMKQKIARIEVKVGLNR